MLDPHLANHNQASSSIKVLAMSLPKMIDENEAGALAVEADKYFTDMQVSELATSYDENQMRIDVHYWAKVFSLNPSHAAIKISINATAAEFICKNIFPIPVQIKKIIKNKTGDIQQIYLYQNVCK